MTPEHLDILLNSKFPYYTGEEGSVVIDLIPYLEPRPRGPLITAKTWNHKRLNNKDEIKHNGRTFKVGRHHYKDKCCYTFTDITKDVKLYDTFAKSPSQVRLLQKRGDITVSIVYFDTRDGI